jgi:imidazolonepropionase
MSHIEIIENAVIHHEDGVITFVGRRQDAPNYKATSTTDCGGRLVTPAFVDAHTHTVFAGNRADEFEQRALGATYQEIAARGGGILSTVSKTRESHEEALLDEAQMHARWIRQSGTGTVEIKSGYGLDLETELKMLRVAKRLESKAMGLSVVRTFLGAHAVPPEADSKAEYLDLVINEMLPAVKDECEFADMFVEDKYFNHDDARRYASAVKKFGLELRLHVDQMSDSGGAALAAELGAKTADHLEYTGEDGIRALSKSDTMPVLLPGSVYGIRSDKYPNAKLMMELGLPIVLATDFNPGSSPTASLPFCMSLAMTKMGMSAAECLTACTINAAYSLNRGENVGSLEPGKNADFIAWHATDYREIAYWIGPAPIAVELPNGTFF